MATKTTKQHWLVKQEPEAYAWADFVHDGGTEWTGVRNFQARNNLRAMRAGDAVLFYASGEVKAVVGVARVRRTAFADPTAAADEGDWSAVELEPVRALAKPVTLGAIKTSPDFEQCALLRQSRLSVVPLSAAEFAQIVELGG
ncbi:MAG TPA: EVE domain-containing protein [Opitutaceae bacterium]|nr:EVE domain-containing protein [Opitutaceae bacterium]